MIVELEIHIAMMFIMADVDARLRFGAEEIDRSVAEHRAWLRHWPNQPPNHRSAGQFLRHMRRRNAEGSQ